MGKPCVSIIVARGSGEDRLAESLDSVRAQTFSDYEVVVSEPHELRASAWNMAIAQSTGEYIAFLDSGDLWAPSKLEKQMAMLAANPNLDWCYCQASKGPKACSGSVLRSLLLENFIPPSSVIVRWTALDEAGGFDESELLQLSEDWDMWLHVAAFHPIGLIAEALVEPRIQNYPIEKLYESRKLVVEAAVCLQEHRLKDLRSEALAEIAVRAGNAYLLANQRPEARDKFAEALIHTPLRSDAYLSWISSFLSSDSQQQIRDLHNLGKRTEGSEKTAETTNEKASPR